LLVGFPKDGTNLARPTRRFGAPAPRRLKVACFIEPCQHVAHRTRFTAQYRLQLGARARLPFLGCDRFA
jgi:hypothetical protein